MRDRQVANYLRNYAGFTRGVISSDKPSDWVNLSDILEKQPLPQKYFLSQKAATGILRRAEKRGKAIPSLLEQALRQVASDGKTNNLQP